MCLYRTFNAVDDTSGKWLIEISLHLEAYDMDVRFSFNKMTQPATLSVNQLAF